MSSRLTGRGRVFAVAGIWQLAAWGGRISLLTEAERFDLWNWIRIGGSLVIGLALVGVAVRGGARLGAWRLAVVFLAFSLLVWGRSLVVVWADPANSLAFNLVHTALATVTWTLAGLCVASTRARPT